VYYFWAPTEKGIITVPETLVGERGEENKGIMKEREGWPSVVGKEQLRVRVE